MPRSKANRLNNAVKGGANLKGPQGQKVKHDPRYSNDYRPWIDDKGNRFPSNEVTSSVD